MSSVLFSDEIESIEEKPRVCVVQILGYSISMDSLRRTFKLSFSSNQNVQYFSMFVFIFTNSNSLFCFFCSSCLVAMYYVVLAKIPIDNEREILMIYLYRNRKHKPSFFFELDEYER